MDRRRFVAMIGSALACPGALWAQIRSALPRIGFPYIATRADLAQFVVAFEEGLRGEGYEPGKDVLIDYRSADGKQERFPAIVQEALQTKPDLLVALTNANIIPMRAATPSIPIVMVAGINVVGSGFVASLARPGGNITGLTWDVGGEIIGKRLDFMREILPKISRVARLYEPPYEKTFAEEINGAAAMIGASVVWIEVEDDIERSFAAAARERADVLLVGSGPRTFGRRKEVTELATRYRLPATYAHAEMVNAGGLLSYAPSIAGLYRRSAWYVARILKGAKPADLPIERPSKLELVINLKAASAIGLKIPQSLLIRADRVIE